MEVCDLLFVVVCRLLRCFLMKGKDWKRNDGWRGVLIDLKIKGVRCVAEREVLCTCTDPADLMTTLSQFPLSLMPAGQRLIVRALATGILSHGGSNGQITGVTGVTSTVLISIGSGIYLPACLLPEGAG